LLAGALSVGAVGQAQAFPSLLSYPDISVGFINLEFNAVTRAFSAHSVGPVSVDWGPTATVPQPGLVSGGGFQMEAIIDAAGNMTSGTFSVFGSAEGPSGGSLSDPVLVASLGPMSQPVENPVGEDLNFVFKTITGGALASDFANGAAVLMKGTNFAGWGSSFFVSDRSAVADIRPIKDGVVPEPGVLALFALGLLGMGYVLRQRGAAAVAA
jgi:hypothetical protein